MIDLVAVDIEGESASVLREHLEDLAATSPTTAIRLLPGHDQWVLGPGTADAHVVPRARRALVSGGANIVIDGGVVSGTWALANDHVAVDWFAEAGPPPRDRLEDEVERLATILGLPLQLSVQDV